MRLAPDFRRDEGYGREQLALNFACCPERLLSPFDAKADGLEELQKERQYRSSVFWTVLQSTFPAVTGRYVYFYSINLGRVHLMNPLAQLLCLILGTWVSSLTQGFV